MGPTNAIVNNKILKMSKNGYIHGTKQHNFVASMFELSKIVL